jgi:iron complex transport system substrate-binding protein
MYDHFLTFLRTQVNSAWLLLTFSLLIISCSQETKVSETSAHPGNLNQPDDYSIRYAVGFNLQTENDYHILQIFSHYNETADTTTYLLTKEGAVVPPLYAGFKTIQVPVDRIALLHSSYISLFDFCGAKDRIKAISEVKYVYDSVVYHDVQNGKLREVGYGESLDKEQLLDIGIDLVVTVGWPNVPNKNQQRLDELGIVQIILSDWQESTLLGRMEWVKVVAALTGTLDLANEKFEEIAVIYDSLTQLTKTLENRPTIICNLPYRGSWYVPGGNSYVSNLLHDAGGRYLWADDKGTGGLQLDFETVYAKGLTAEFWMNPGFSFSLQDVTDKDQRLKDFSAVRNGKVYNSVNKISRNQANDYWESGITNPHLILADMIHILHPELLPDHQMVYYKSLF